VLIKIRKVNLVILLVLVGCSFWFLASAAEPPGLAKLGGAEKARVVKRIDGAKKEGRLVGYSVSLRPDVQEALNSKFREWYGFSEADLQLNFVSMRSDAIVTKVTEELRAKVYKADLINNAAIDWFNDLIARGELMPYDSPEYRHFSPLSVNPEMAPSNPPYFIAGYFTTRCITYNPKHIKGEIVHWKDALRPEYKGKISCTDVSNSASHTEAYLPLVKVLGAGYFKELAKQDPFLLVSSSDLTNKAVSGEYPIVVMGGATTAFRANLNGAALKLVFPAEGWAAIGYQTVILTRAPHPNAAKLFLDFFHSEVAQKILLEEEGYAVGRLGVKSKYPEFPRPIYDVKGAIPMDWRKVTAKDRDKAREEFRRLVIEKK
jgi:iron(III) transport system substrate-binding protein